MATKSKSNEIKISRLYDAPVKAVWDAWTDVEQVKQWWGPRGFTITSHSKDLRAGGVWHYTMHGPDGTDYPNKTKYLEVDPMQRMVYDHGGNDERAPLFRVTVTFKEVGGKTQMDMTMALASPEAAEEAQKFIKKANGNSTWDRLAECLAKAEGSERFVINRSFDAPIERMWAMWTEPEHLTRWMAPKGFDMKLIRGDIRVGGSTFYSMSSAGVTMHGRAEYRELSAPHRLVYTQQFVDENERLSRHPAAPTWPATMLTVVTLAEEAPDRTRVTITWEPYGEVAPAELETFVQARSGMNGGWTGSFDKLDEVLAA